MNTDIIVAIIGALTSICVAWITTRPKARTTDPSSRSGYSFVSVLALGLAITAIIVGVFTFSESRSAQLKVVKTTITAHTQDYRGDESVPHYDAPRVDNPAKKHALDISCPAAYVPVAAWHEIIGSHPSADAMYTVNPNVEDEKVYIYLRAREGATGYSYVEVFVLCSRLS